MQHHISSHTKISGTRSEFTHEINIPSDHTHISLVAVQLPKTFYAVVQNHNDFLLDGQIYTLPHGNYSVTTLIQALNALISPTQVSFSRTEFKLTFSGGTRSSLSFPGMSRLWRTLGFDQNVVNLFEDDLLISTNVINLAAIQQVSIICDLVNDLSVTAFGNSLATIYPNSSPDMSFIWWNNPQIKYTGKMLKQSSSKSNQMITYNARFSVIDDFEHAIEFNGHDVHIILYSWKQEQTYDMIKNFLSAIVNILNENRIQQN